MRPESFLGRLAAHRLAAHAGRVLPQHRSEWALAMQSEIDHLPSSRAALRWALGCVFASYIERMHVMNLGNLRISRWVLSLEMLMCFFWLTWMFGALVSRGVYGFSGPLPIDRWYLMMLFGTVVGPIGLIVAFKSIVLNRPSMSWFTLAALCLPAAWTFIAFLGQILSARYPVEALGGFVLFALLPALGVAHLVHLARSRANVAAAA
jgi:hypothetical protein